MIVLQWLKYLRNEFPTLAFKASTQNQKENLARSKIDYNLASEQLLQSSQCLGAETLMKLLGKAENLPCGKDKETGQFKYSIAWACPLYDSVLTHKSSKIRIHPKNYLLCQRKLIHLIYILQATTADLWT